jgi:predicted nucleic acid-binding protein
VKYLLDTNIISETIRPAAQAACLEWLAAHEAECVISTVTVAELRYGVERLPEGKRKRNLAKKLDYLHQEYRERVLVFDENAAAEWGRYMAKLEDKYGQGVLEQIDYPDIQNAAIALAYGLKIVTYNERDFPTISTVNPLRGG